MHLRSLEDVLQTAALWRVSLLRSDYVIYQHRHHSTWTWYTGLLHRLLRWTHLFSTSVRFRGQGDKDKGEWTGRLTLWHGRERESSRKKTAKRKETLGIKDINSFYPAQTLLFPEAISRSYFQKLHQSVRPHGLPSFMCCCALCTETTILRLQTTFRWDEPVPCLAEIHNLKSPCVCVLPSAM